MAASMAVRCSRARSAGSPMRRAASEAGSMGRGRRGGREGGVGVVEVLEEDAGVGDGAAAGGVGGDGADLLEGFGGGEPVGILDEEQDAADFVEGGDGAAGDDGEVGGEGGDGDEAEVGGAGVELVGADGGRGVVDVVVLAEGGVRWARVRSCRAAERDSERRWWRRVKAQFDSRRMRRHSVWAADVI